MLSLNMQVRSSILIRLVVSSIAASTLTVKTITEGDASVKCILPDGVPARLACTLWAGLISTTLYLRIDLYQVLMFALAMTLLALFARLAKRKSHQRSSSPSPSARIKRRCV
jgi:hypothetical protein